MNVCFLCLCMFMFIRMFACFSICKPSEMFMKSQWNKCFHFFYLGCYLSVWYCYLDSILAFNVEIQISYNLWTKPLNQPRLIYEQFIYVLYLDLVVYISFAMNKSDWLIDWLIDREWNITTHRAISRTTCFWKVGGRPMWEAPK